jgi:hypothetical protein
MVAKAIMNDMRWPREGGTGYYIKAMRAYFSRWYFPGALYLGFSLMCAVFSCLMAITFPEDGRVINPFITLAVYLLPVISAYLFLNGLYILHTARAGRPSRGLGDDAVLFVLRRWSAQDRRLRGNVVDGENGKS